MGPFTFKEEDFTPQSYVFRKNPNYHEKGQPYIDGVRYTSYAGGQATQDAIVAGDIDWASNVFQDPEKQLAGAPVDYITMPSSAQVLVTCSSAEMGCTGPSDRCRRPQGHLLRHGSRSDEQSGVLTASSTIPAPP